MRLFRTTLKVKRAASGQDGFDDGNGNWIESDQSTDQFTIKCSLQPVSENDLSKLEDAFKRTSVVKIFTNTLLKSVDEDADTEADTIIIDDHNYQVQLVDNWREGKLKHFEVLAAKEEKPF